MYIDEPLGKTIFVQIVQPSRSMNEIIAAVSVF